MRDPFAQAFYAEIIKPGSTETEVHQFWQRILPEYFPREKFSVTLQSRVNPDNGKQLPNLIIRRISLGLTAMKVVIMEHIGRQLESQDWTKHLERLTQYMKQVRSEWTPEEAAAGVLYGSVNIGTTTRFFQLHPFEQECVDYPGSDEEPLELVNDEETIHKFLTEIAAKVAEE